MKNERHKVEIRDLGSSGEGVGSIGEYTVFVDGILPGETGIVEVVETRKNFCRAKLVEITKHSENRIEPICPVFGVCGGCQIMHLNYQAQLQWKKERITESLKRIGKIDPLVVKEVSPSVDELYYRNKIQLPATNVKGKIALGLYKKASHKVIPITKCFIHNALGEGCFQKVGEILEKSSLEVYDEESKKGYLRNVLIRTAVKNKQILVMFIVTGAPSAELKRVAKEVALLENVVSVFYGKNERDDNVLFPNEVILLEGRECIQEEVLGLNIQLSPQSFFQVNTGQAEKIYQKAFSLANVKSGEKALDLFCGIGIFACFLAKKGIDVTGVEVVPKAIEDAKANAKRNGVSIHAIVATAEKYMKEAPPVDVVFVNPPRKGCEETVISAMIHMRPSRVVYTSCDPATLARDAKLLEEGGYKSVEFHPFDLFPQTVHVETVALFQKI